MTPHTTDKSGCLPVIAGVLALLAALLLVLGSM